jgi:hypothetical protein
MDSIIYSNFTALLLLFTKNKIWSTIFICLTLVFSNAFIYEQTIKEVSDFSLFKKCLSKKKQLRSYSVKNRDEDEYI